MSKVTIYDIAKVANVSTATVSLALSGNERIRPETRQRILDIAHELGYTPSYIAQSLSKKSTNTIGLIVPNISNPVFSQMVSGIETYANAKGYNLIFGLSDANREKELFYLDMLQSKRVDGLIILPTFMDVLKEKLDTQTSFKSSIVLCGSSGASTDVDISYAKCDNHAGALLAIEHLVKTGRKRIGCIFPVTDEQQCHSRKTGYIAALKKHNIEYDDALLKICANNDDAIFATTRQLVTEQKPDAIFCSSDYNTISVMRALSSLGLCIPKDISVIGYDNIPVASYLPTSLSTIDTRSMEVGQKAAELLIEKITHPDTPVRQITLKPELVIRESTTL